MTRRAPRAETTETRNDASGVLSGLTDRLERARRRRRALLLTGAAMASLSVALGLYSLLELLVWANTRWEWALPLGPRTPVQAAVGAFLATMTWRTVGSVLNTPTLSTMALLADARYNTGERLTTALETARRGPGNVAEHALLYDATTWTERIEPRELVPATPPRPLWPPVLLLLAALGLQALPAANALPSTGATVSTDGVPTSETGTRVRRVAELVARDAEERRDSYLQAVARSLDDLGARIERGELERVEAEREVARLLQHLGRALGEDDPDVAELLSALDASTADTRPAPQGAEPADASEPSEAGELPAAQEPQAGPQEGSPAEAGNPLPPDLENILTQLEARLEKPEATEDAAAARRRPQTGQQGQMPEFYTDVDPELIAQLRERQEQLAAQRAEQLAAGQPVGAAERSNEGAGDMAGEGNQPLERGLPDQFGLEENAGEGQSVALPENERSEGRRIEVEVAPEAQFTAVEGNLQSSGARWRRRNEAAVGNGYLDIIDRDVVSKYFLPPGQVE